MDSIGRLSGTGHDSVLAAMHAIVGDSGLVLDPTLLDGYLKDERGLYHGSCLAVVRPASASQAAAVVAFCASALVPIVPLGGNTGLVGGGVPQGGIVLSTERLTRIRAVDALDRTITVEAGVILADVQAAADAAGALFPLSLAAEGSCRIGGNLSTNAGGINVLRYGNARDLVLGLEVVLADGRIWNGLHGLRKNNTGYDLKHLFLGAEGTLGVITAAVLKLFSKPRTTETAFVAVPSAAAAVDVFHRLNDVAGDALSGFELIGRTAVAFCLRHVSGCSDPFEAPHPWYVLLRLTSPRRDDPLREALEAALSAAWDDGVVADAVIAHSEAQAASLWRLRESIPAAQKPEGGSIKNDVSVPLSRVPEFLEKAAAALEAALPAIRPVPFGHLGDGNIHYNLTQPLGMDRVAYLALWPKLERIVSEIAIGLGGSFSAEHGIGQLKRDSLLRYKAPVEIEMMRRIKQTLDPHGIMNPGKVL